MSFSPAFRLLAKFTEGIEPSRKGGDASWAEIDLVSQYLGVAVEHDDRRTCIEQLSHALTDQNRFLTANLASDKIVESDFYKSSMFIREIVDNNRRGYGQTSDR